MKSKPFFPHNRSRSLILFSLVLSLSLFSCAQSFSSDLTSIKTSSNEPFTTEPISAEPKPFSDIEVKIHSSKRIEDASLLDFLPLGVTVYLGIKPLTDSGQYYHEGLDSKELSLQNDPSEIEAVDIASLRIDPNEDRETPIQNAVYALTAKGGEGKAMFTMLY